MIVNSLMAISLNELQLGIYQIRIDDKYTFIRVTSLLDGGRLCFWESVNFEISFRKFQEKYEDYDVEILEMINLDTFHVDLPKSTFEFKGPDGRKYTTSMYGELKFWKPVFEYFPFLARAFGVKTKPASFTENKRFKGKTSVDKRYMPKKNNPRADSLSGKEQMNRLTQQMRRDRKRKGS
ncbi:MAG: hypothetical protein AAF363_14485 [Bacteroidota bacterium]